MLTDSLLLSELHNAINSRRSPALGIDFTSPLLIKSFPSNGTNSLLNIINSLFSNSVVPSSWRQFKVISISKPNSFLIVYRSIAFLSFLCKITKRIIKTRLNYWLEHHLAIPNNLFSFRKGLETVECLLNLVSLIYKAFNNRGISITAFIDIFSTYDCFVHF